MVLALGLGRTRAMQMRMGIRMRGCVWPAIWMPCFRLCSLGIGHPIAPQSFCTGLYVKMHGLIKMEGVEFVIPNVGCSRNAQMRFDFSSWKRLVFLIKCYGFIAAGGSTRRILQVMNSRMHMNFSFPCSMGSTKRWRRIGGKPTVKVNCFPFLKSAMLLSFAE